MKNVDDLSSTVNEYKKFIRKNADTDCVMHRYVSFDFCYNYFRTNRENLIESNSSIEMSCFVLWSYLASWGMLRGSSFLLQKNPAYLKQLITYISRDCQDLFDIDVNSYNENIDKILKAYDGVEKCISSKENKATLTLVTKIMLGVFGCIPAYDTNFKSTFTAIAKMGFKNHELTEKSLNCIYEFYKLHEPELETLRLSCNVIDFNGNCTDYKYTRAKIIDMYGFQKKLQRSSKR